MRRCARTPKLFASIHLINDGTAFSWDDNNEIDMSASSIQRLAEEAIDRNRTARTV